MITPKECEKRFGKPKSKQVEKHLVLFDVPTELEIGVIPKKIYCHNLLVTPLTKAFKNLIERGFVNELKTWDGCFNPRLQRGSKTIWSIHTWGLAIDVNAAWNGLGHKPKLSANFVKCFTDAGFYWGGNFKRLDGMHFELENF
jgi:D-alanyl-D-alanine carboxypeptidase